MKRVLVTGAGGVVGNALVARLKDRGYDVTAVSSRCECDLESFEQAKALCNFTKPDGVFHLAAAVHGIGGNIAFPGDIIRRNLSINLNVVHAALLAGVKKVVAMGSTAVYSDEAKLPMREVDVLRGMPHASEQFYGYSKRTMAMHLESYRVQYGLQYAVALCTNVYGPHDRFDVEYGHVVPSLVRKFYEAEIGDRVVNVWGDGSATRDFIFSDDAALGLELLMKQGAGLYNLATGDSHRIRDLVEILQKLFPTVSVKWDTSKPNGQLVRSYDISNIAGLGFSPRFDLQAGIERTVAWYRSNFEYARGATAA
jgi:GDP-L-fucose synthase